MMDTNRNRFFFCQLFSIDSTKRHCISSVLLTPCQLSRSGLCIRNLTNELWKRWILCSPVTAFGSGMLRRTLLSSRMRILSSSGLPSQGTVHPMRRRVCLAPGGQVELPRQPGRLHCQRLEMRRRMQHMTNRAAREYALECYFGS